MDPYLKNILSPNFTPTTNIGNSNFLTPVVTSKVADKNVADIKSQHADITTGMANQAAKAKADADAKAVLDANAKSNADKLKLDQDTLKVKQDALKTPQGQAAILPNGVEVIYDPKTESMTTQDGKSLTWDIATNAWVDPATKKPPVPKVASSTTGETAQGQLDQTQIDYQAKADSVVKTIEGITNGSIPLNAAEQAQVDGLKKQFQDLIAQQELTNKGATGTANIRGYQQGAAEYDPNFHTNIISSVITAGANKIADLNIKMASSVAQLTQAFKDNNIKNIKTAWDVYQSAAKDRIDTLQKTIENSQKAVKDAQEALQKKADAEAKVEAEELKNKNEILTSARKNMAPPEVVRAIQDTIDAGGDVADVVNAAGDYGSDATGVLGDYYQYKREGGSMNFQGYRDWDDNNKAKVAAAVNAAGLNKDQQNKVAGLLDDYDKQVKDIKTVLTQSDNIKSLGAQALSTNKDAGTRAASQIGLIFSFMKVLDPSSTVREGEYATAQNTAGVTDQIRNAYNKAVDGSFLTDGQIKGYMATAESLAEVRRRNKETIDEEFDRRAGLYGVPKGTITGTTTDKLLAQHAKEKVDNYIKSNPKEADRIIKLYETPSPAFGGKVPTDEQVAEYLNLQ